MSLVGRNLLLVLVILLPLSAQQSCDSFLGSQQLDYALPGYTFDCYTTNDVFSCALRCLSHDRCKSCNYALSGPQRGLCELNSEGRHASNRLQYRPGFVFVQVIVKQVGFESVYVRRSKSLWHALVVETKAGLRRKHNHKHQHKPRVNRDDASIATTISHVWTGTTQAQTHARVPFSCASVVPVHTWLMLALVLVLASYVQTSLNPFTPKSDQCQISPAASQEILHYTVRRTWLYIAYSWERWVYYQFSFHRFYISV